MNNQFEHIAQITHRIMTITCKIIVLVSEKYKARLSGMRAYPNPEENKKVIELHWSSENITLRVDIMPRESPLSIGVVMPDNADKELQKKLWEVSEINKDVIMSFGGDGIPRVDRTGDEKE